MKKTIVYRLTFPNGKVYIGITSETLKKRISRHVNYARAGRSYALSSAIRKYGESAFTAEEVASGEWDAMLAEEIRLISAHQSIVPHGYNMTAGGEGSLGVSCSAEKRQKISYALSGRKLSEAHKSSVREAQRGKLIPQSVREKMRSASLGKEIGQAQREKTRSALKGRKISPEVIAKRLATRYGR